MDEPSTSKRPVFPSRFLEADHNVLGVNACLSECTHQFFEKFLLDLDAAPNRPEDLNQGKFFVSLSLDIRVRLIEAEVLRRQFDYPLEPVCRRHARGEPRGVDGL